MQSKNNKPIMSHFYTHSIKTATKSVVALIAILNKIPQYIEESKNQRGLYLLDENYILTSRISPEMFPLSRQLMIVSDNLKGFASRMSGVEAPKMEDNQTTIAEMIARLQATVDFVNSISPELYLEADTRKATLPWLPQGSFLDMEDYVTEFAIPNLYFHIVTSYNILRNVGLDLGKTDFIGGMNIKGM